MVEEHVASGCIESLFHSFFVSFPASLLCLISLYYLCCISQCLSSLRPSSSYLLFYFTDNFSFSSIIFISLSILVLSSLPYYSLFAFFFFLFYFVTCVLSCLLLFLLHPFFSHLCIFLYTLDFHFVFLLFFVSFFAFFLFSSLVL